MINFLQPMVWTHHGPLNRLGQRFFEWLLADAGDLTPKRSLILIAIFLIFATIVICYGIYRPRKKSSYEDQPIHSINSIHSITIFIWVIREIKNYLVNKIRRKKR
jgi:hypothetical protein